MTNNKDRRKRGKHKQKGNIPSNRNRNTTYQTNLSVLYETYPEIAELLTKLPADSPYEIRAKDNNLPNVWLKDQEIYYYRQENCMQDVREQLAALKLKNTRLAVFLGMGLSYEVYHFLQHMAPEQRTRHVLIVEPNPYMFRAAMEAVDITELLQHKAIYFMVGVDENDLYTRFRTYINNKSRYVYLLAMKPVYHISSLSLHKDYYIKALQIFREAAGHVILNYGNDPHDSLIGIQNMLSNLQEIVSNPGINLLYDKFKNKPAVIVATGPSLNKNKHLLKELEDKALIISVDASLKILMEMGLKPHLVTSLERVMPTVKLLEGFDRDQVEDVFLAACPVVRPEMYEAYPGPRVIVYRNFDHFRWLNIDKGILDIQASAGNMAFKVAEALGCNPIILIGQDLAFGRDGMTHASGTLYGEKNPGYEKDQRIQVMGNDGYPIDTTLTWSIFLKGYEMDLAQYKGKCINSTEGGAYINGTEVMPFKEAIEKYIKESFNPLDIIKRELGVFSVAHAAEDIQNMLLTIRETRQDLEEITADCKAGLVIYEKYKEMLQKCLQNPESLDKSLRADIDRIEEEITAPQQRIIRSYKTFQNFLAHVLQSYHIKFRMDMAAVPEKYDDFDFARVEMMLSMAQWYVVIGELVEICLESLLKAQKNVENLVS